LLTSEEEKIDEERIVNTAFLIYIILTILKERVPNPQGK